jgi:hypothetical protein
MRPMHILNPMILVAFGLAFSAAAAEPGETDRLIAELQSTDYVTTFKALAELPRIAPSDARAQEAAIAYLERYERQGRSLRLAHAILLSRFDASFAMRLLDKLNGSANNPRIASRDLWLLTIACMREKASQAAPRLAALLPNVTDKEFVASIRMVLILFGYKNEENLPWLAEQIRNRTRGGARAMGIAALLGLGPAAENKAVRQALIASLNIANKDLEEDADRSIRAVALAISGCRDAEAVGRVKRLYARAKADIDAGAIAMIYAYALSWMDKDHIRDYWRLILANLPEQGRLGRSAFEGFVLSIPKSSVKLIAELRSDPDPAVKKGADEATQGLTRLGYCSLSERDASESHKNR